MKSSGFNEPEVMAHPDEVLDVLKFHADYNRGEHTLEQDQAIQNLDPVPLMVEEPSVTLSTYSPLIISLAYSRFR